MVFFSLRVLYTVLIIGTPLGRKLPKGSEEAGWLADTYAFTPTYLMRFTAKKGGRIAS
jgi:hypothetical protein